MDKHELSLLLYLETCAVDHGGKVDSRYMNAADFSIVEGWKKSGYVSFGRICYKDITNRSHWVELSEAAWNSAHAERKERYKRINGRRTWKKTEEKETLL